MTEILSCGWAVGDIVELLDDGAFKAERVADHGRFWRVVSWEACEVHGRTRASRDRCGVPIVALRDGKHIIVTNDHYIQLAGPEALLEVKES